VVVGCTSAGEVGPAGLSQGAVVALGLSPPARGAASWLSDQGATSFALCQQAVRDCAAQLGLRPEQLDPRRHLLITLTAPFGGSEDRLLAALADAAPGIPIVGGSAGDDFAWRQTRSFRGAEVADDGGLVLLLEPGVDFRCFAIHHFAPSAERVVVTGVREEPRRVASLNGWPAFTEYARLAGLRTPAQVEACRASGTWPLHFGFRVRGELYVRAVMTEVDGDLLLGGAVEEGMVLTVLEEGDLIAATERGVRDALSALPGPAGALLLFNCGGRLLQARRDGTLPALWAAMCQVPSAGFSTYGEQYGSVQVSFTLSGVAFGVGPPLGGDPP
jgi:hypothetical protein